MERILEEGLSDFPHMDAPLIAEGVWKQVERTLEEGLSDSPHMDAPLIAAGSMRWEAGGADPRGGPLRLPTHGCSTYCCGVYTVQKASN